MSNKYNGWTNYETWLCKLWMDNDGDSYFVDLASDSWRDSFADGPFTRADMASREMAGYLRNYWDALCEEQCPQTGFFADLINAGMSAVNWDEIARSYIDMLELDEAA